jgi:hypothetical protein
MLDKLETARSRKKETKKLIDRLGKLPPRELDEIFHEAHEEVFACTDCLQCANCCKTTGPLFTRKDIERIAQYLKMKPGDFTEKYLRIDEDQDYVLQKTPCAFLKEDNYCSIYDVRPKACREYPHTDMQQMQTKLKITYLNATICPAVADILEKIKAKV